MIILLGTSHVSKRSAREVKEAIATADIVALELDSRRASGLLSKERASFGELRKALGLKAALIATVLRRVQESLGEQLGIKPGAEFKAALLEAKKQGKLVALIDRDITITMRRLSASIGRKELWQLCKDLFRPRKIAVHPDDDLVAQLLEELQHQYPRIHTVMVKERDEHMARALAYLAEKHPDQRILAVVGKGHVPGMRERINYLNKQADVVLWRSPATN